MLDPIISAKEKLDDPLMLEWALRYYNDLPENKLEEKARIESTWFHDLFIAQLIEQMKPKRCFAYLMRYQPSISHRLQI